MVTKDMRRERRMVTLWRPPEFILSGVRKARIVDVPPGRLRLLSDDDKPECALPSNNTRDAQ